MAEQKVEELFHTRRKLRAGGRYTFYATVARGSLTIELGTPKTTSKERLTTNTTPKQQWLVSRLIMELAALEVLRLFPRSGRWYYSSTPRP
jgi:hypothetical protein